jgi:hypothetical protein
MPYLRRQKLFALHAAVSGGPNKSSKGKSNVKIIPRILESGKQPKGRWRKFHDEEIPNSFASQKTIMAIK